MPFHSHFSHLSGQYVSWRSRSEPDYKEILFIDKKILLEHLQKTFMYAVMNRCIVGRDGNAAGYFGLCLKSEPMIGYKSMECRQKRIEQIDPITKQVLQTFRSLAHASHEIGVQPTNMSKYIRNNSTYKNHQYSYIETVPVTPVT